MLIPFKGNPVHCDILCDKTNEVTRSLVVIIVGHFYLAMLLLVAGCSTDRRPYEDTFKKAVVRNLKVEPIVEMLTIDSRLDSVSLKNYFKKELNERWMSDKAQAKLDYENYVIKYNNSVKFDGKSIADRVYLSSLKEAKEMYDQLLNGARDSIRYKFYYDRMKHPTIFEEITVKFRLSKDGPLIVERYRTDIFKGDTSLYELKDDATIIDYIK
jgi:hypothetical protein